MKIAALSPILLALLLSSCATPPRLEGSWSCVSATVNGKPLSDATIGRLRLTLTNDRYKTQRGDEVLFDSTYTTDSSKKPHHIDLVGTEGDLTGKKAQGIYAVHGDVLEICYTMPGKKRPVAFESQPESGAHFIVWKRRSK
jgi:uncharacterized protein (TIGR03067 family)